ncbi:MAG: transposase [Pseudomonadales bacterium]|nr:transposase [Pseudomonadales bacterium]
MPWDDLQKKRESITNQIYFITFNTKNREPQFEAHKAASIFCQQIKINETQMHCKWITWVLMPDHFHGLVQIQDKKLQRVMSDLKGRTAYALNKQLERQGAFWQKQYYEHTIRKDEDIKEIARYIVANPLRKKLVQNIKEYPYWNSDYL